MSRENTHSAVPEVHEVMAMPAVAGALQSILGEGYSLHPHTFTHIKDDVGADQDWHKSASPRCLSRRSSVADGA